MAHCLQWLLISYIDKHDSRTQPPLQRTRHVNTGFFGRSVRNGVTHPTCACQQHPRSPWSLSQTCHFSVCQLVVLLVILLTFSSLGQVEELTEGSGGATGVEMRIDITAKKRKVLHQFLGHTCRCRCSELFYILCQRRGISFVGFFELFDDF